MRQRQRGSAHDRCGVGGCGDDERRTGLLVPLHKDVDHRQKKSETDAHCNQDPIGNTRLYFVAR